MVYRTQIVLIYYSYAQSSTTPTPFAEIRIVIYTKSEISRQRLKKFFYPKILRTIIETEWQFLSLRAARLSGEIRIEDPDTTIYDDDRKEIVGQEINLEIEKQEMIMNLAELTLPKSLVMASPKTAINKISRNIKNYFNKLFKYVIFYDDDGYSKKYYTNYEINKFLPEIIVNFPKPTIEKFIELSDFTDLDEIFGVIK